jgi:hypothetical protein
MLRFMAWLCLKDNALSGSQMCIVTGPRIELAIALIDRMKALFRSGHMYAYESHRMDKKMGGNYPPPRVPLNASFIIGPNVCPLSVLILITGISLVWFLSHHVTNTLSLNASI